MYALIVILVDVKTLGTTPLIVIKKCFFFMKLSYWYKPATITSRKEESLCGNKMPTRCNRLYLLQILLYAQHVSGNTMPIIRSSRVLYRWSLPVVFGALVFRLSVWCGAEGYVSGLQAAALKNTTPYRQPENQSTKYHRQRPSV